MALFFDQSGGGGRQYIATSAGAIGAAGTGAYTMVCLLRPANIYTGVITLASGSYSGTDERQIGEESGNMFGANDFTSGVGPFSASTWYLLGQSKGAGSNPYRWHYWAYAADGSGTKTHADNTATYGEGSTIAGVRLGDAYYEAWSDFALWAVWNRELSDADFEELCGNTAQAFMDLSTGGPDAMWLCNVSDPANVIDVTGGGADVITVVGTDPATYITPSSDPPSFDYTIGNGIEFVQSKVAGSVSSSPVIAGTFDSSNTAGNTLIAFASWDNGSGITATGISDTQGNTWTQISSHLQVSDHQWGALYACVGCAAGSNTVTVSLSTSAGYRVIALAEYSGVASIDIDTLNDAYLSSSGTDNASSGTDTTTADNETIVGIFAAMTDGASAFTAGTGMTERSNTTTIMPILIEDSIQPTAGSAEATASYSGSATNYLGYMLTLQPGAPDSSSPFLWLKL